MSSMAIHLENADLQLNSLKKKTASPPNTSNFLMDILALKDRLRIWRISKIYPTNKLSLLQSIFGNKIAWKIFP